MYNAPGKPTDRVYTTADLARWFHVDVEEIRAWVAEGAKPSLTGSVVVLDQMVGRRCGKGPWQFRMRPAMDRKGTSRPPTAARRARKKARTRGQNKKVRTRPTKPRVP